MKAKIILKILDTDPDYYARDAEGTAVVQNGLRRCDGDKKISTIQHCQKRAIADWQKKHEGCQRIKR